MAFFTATELSKSAAIKIDTENLQPKCLDCGLNKGCKNPKMVVHGEGKKGILIIGEFPDAECDEYGTPMAGEALHLLKNELWNNGISLNRDCWKINAVNCAVFDVDGPNEKQIDYCRNFVERTIRELKPKTIFLMGSIAITSLFGKDFSKREVDRFRMHCIPDEKFQCNIIPMYSPTHVVKFNKDKNLSCLFSRDIKQAVALSKRQYLERIDYEKYVTILRDFKAVKTILERVLREKPKLMIDYETTGLKPYRKGHKLCIIGFAISTKESYVFPFDYNQFWTFEEKLEIRKLWLEIMLDQSIGKMAQNFKFEDAWTRVMIGARPKGWYWCTQTSEHILDNRKMGNGLKFMTFVRFGVRPYDKYIEKFLEAADGTEFNTIEQAPFKEIMTYCGLDNIFAYMHYERQISLLSKMKGLQKAFNFFMKGTHVMGTIEANGIAMNMDHYKTVKKEMLDKIAENEKYLMEGREAQKFKEKYGYPIKLTSNQDLGKLVYEVLGKPAVRTAKGGYKTDKLTLAGLNLPFIDKLSEKKRFEKAVGTYIGQFTREVYQGVMHPFFDLANPVSYRSSSSRPNWQNLPKRDKEIKTKIRQGIIPSLDYLGEIDFSGAEVITAACYNKDKNFLNYLLDKSTDMHRDLASELFLLPPDMLKNAAYNKEQNSLASMVRFYAKNNWTFAQFYGDWFGSCGPNLWENAVASGLKLPNGQTVLDWLDQKGIYELGTIERGRPTPGSFLEHCKEVEDNMWNVRFAEYTQWKKDIVEFYQKWGYIETYFGFRFVGYMDRKQCCNFPIQGTSFHLLVYTLIYVDKFLRQNKCRSKICGQIHDSQILDLAADEVSFVLGGINDIINGLKDRFDWLIVPMEAEMEISKHKLEGGNFSSMDKITIEEVNSKVWTL